MCVLITDHPLKQFQPTSEDLSGHWVVGMVPALCHRLSGIAFCLFSTATSSPWVGTLLGEARWVGWCLRWRVAVPSSLHTWLTQRGAFILCYSDQFRKTTWGKQFFLTQYILAVKRTHLFTHLFQWVQLQNQHKCSDHQLLWNPYLRSENAGFQCFLTYSCDNWRNMKE